MRYLDPKADLTFKRVFGEHPDLVMSLLNALLPLDGPGEQVVSVEYLPAEMVPETPLRKNSIVDVRCKDSRGRQFIVEMQMVWSREFKHRVLFNASKAYVRQIGTGEDYQLLQPVYSLNLVNDVFEPDMEQYYHYYRLVHSERDDKVIDGLHLVFVELPKFRPTNYGQKRMQVLWLRYLTEISDQTRQVSPDLLQSPEVRKAVTAIEESAFTDAQLLGYEKFWDTVSVERTLYNSIKRRYAEGMEEGHEKGLKEGLAQGREQGLAQGREQGLAQGREQGLAQGREQGLAQGREQGLAQGREQGLAQGREQGLAQGLKEGLAQGREQGLAQGREQGLAQGREQGERAKQMEIARNLKAIGLDTNAIAKATGLEPSDIDSL